MKQLSLIFCIGLLSACASQPQIVGGDKLDQSYAFAGGAFDEGGTIIIAAKARNSNGRLEICGARIQSKIAASAPNAADAVVEASRIELNGRTVMQNLSQLNTVEMTNNVNGQPTTCLLFEDPLDGSPDSLTVNVPFLQMRFDRENITTFFPGPVAQVIGERPATEAEIAAAAEAERARLANSEPTVSEDDMRQR